jgi:hypothetical protein
MKLKNIQPRLRGRYASKKPRQIIMTFMALASISAISYLFRYEPLLSPCDPQGCHAEPIVIASPAMAKEPEVVIMCDAGVEEYLQCEIAKGNLTRDQVEIMTAIAKAESGLRPRAKNPKSTASGVFQILAGTWYHYDCVGDKWDWKDNTKCAIKIMKKSGYKPWEVYNKGTYKKFL